MKLGLISDSHGRVDSTRQAVQLLTARSCDVFVHLGDVGTEAVLDELIGHNARVVFGNCDWEIESLSRHAQCMGIKVDHPLGLLEAEGKRIAFTHGHLTNLLTRAFEEKVDYLLHGHTHEVRDELVAGVRIINPGALHRAARYTAAVLDLATDLLEIVEISRS